MHNFPNGNPIYARDKTIVPAEDVIDAFKTWIQAQDNPCVVFEDGTIQWIPMPPPSIRPEPPTDHVEIPPGNPAKS